MSWASRLVWPDDRGELRRPEWGGLTRRDRWGGQAGSLNCGCRFDFRFVGYKTSTSSTKILERAIRRGFRKVARPGPGGISHDGGHEEKGAG